jgi:hypothetical protein
MIIATLDRLPAISAVFLQNMALLVAKERSRRFSCTLVSPQQPLNKPGQLVQPDREIRLCNNVGNSKTQGSTSGFDHRTFDGCSEGLCQSVTRYLLSPNCGETLPRRKRTSSSPVRINKVSNPACSDGWHGSHDVPKGH